MVKRNEKRGYSRNLMGTAKHGEVCLGAKRKRLGRVVGTSCGASIRFLTRYNGEVREPLVWC